MTDDNPGGGGDDPKPKRRRKPPRGLEGFDTGFPEDQVDEGPSTSTGAPRRSPWSESAPSPPPPASDPPAAAATQPPPDTTTTPETIRPEVASNELEVTNGPEASSSTAVDPTLVRSTLPVYRPGDSGASAIPEPRSSTLDSGPAGVAELPLGSGGSAGVAQPASSPMAWGASAPADGDDVLPAQHAGGDLREAVGAGSRKHKRAETPRPDESFEDDGRPRSRKTIVVSLLSLVVGLGIAAIVFLGRQNSAWFYIACEPDRIVAQQGRSFPPWGESALEGKQWAPIKIPAEAECIALETESEDELATEFRAMLVKRASVLLTAKEVTKTDEANALLEQALLHARGADDPARNARAEIQRLLGDVVYWRASLKMHDAAKALLEAATQFDAAAQQRPRHVTDAAAWAEYVRKVVGDLKAGPSGSTQTGFPPAPTPSEPRPPAPPGVALPVEPDAGSIEQPPPTPDAGLPTGGVLL